MTSVWLKWTKGLTRKPEVVAIASELGISRHETASRLMEIWEWADDNTTGCHVASVTKPFLDEVAGVTGFADAMISAGWLIEEEDGLTFPRFDRHNGKTAKTRALAAERKRKQRENVTEESRTDRDKVVTREEKKREEISKTPKESCSEPSSNGSKQTDDTVVMEFPTVGTGAKTWPLTQAKIDEYAVSFPALDILAECRKARQWCIDNPRKRKTARGMTRYLNNWLSKAQDEHGGQNGNGNGKPLRQDSPARIRD